ncbi:MAG TPA: response regulator, partial [Polyangiales bacterium]|nr:response regulator [Polyangiales bacterium]
MPHVMVVEDEPITAADLEHKLAALGHEVSWFDSGEEALAYAGALLPDLVLMDIRLRGALDGLETARRLRERRDVPVVFITAFSDPATVDRACDVEPHGYLLKPFTERSVAAAVKTALARAHAERTQLERERWITRAVQQAGDAVLAVDEQTSIRFINVEAERLLGVRAQDVIGTDAREILRFTDAADNGMHPLDAALRGGRSTSSGARCLRAPALPGELIVAYSTAPIHTRRGETAGAVVVFREAEAEPGAASSTSLIALDELSRRLAHEINNPLTYNLGALSLAQRELEELRTASSLQADHGHTGAQALGQQVARISEYLQSAQEGATRVAEVVRELKQFSLSEREHTSVEPAELLPLAIALSKLEAVSHIRWVRSIDDAPTVQGSRMQLASVLAYAMCNAVEMVQRRGVSGITVVTAVTTDAEGWAELRVTACGPAAGPAGSGETAGARSTTVSSKLAEQVVESHGGELVRTDFPTGRAFALYLPAETSRPRPSTARGHDSRARVDIALCMQ